MRAVNLLPRDIQQTRTGGGRTSLLVAAGGIAAVTAASVVMLLSASGSIDDQRARLHSVETAIARIPAKESPAVAPGVLAQERTERTAAFSAALATRVPMDRLLSQIAHVLPEDAWLTGFSAAAPESAAPAATATGSQGATSSAAAPGVSIVGATYSHSSVARVLSRLAAIPTLDDVRLAASARVVVGSPEGKAKKPVVTFVINANLRIGGSA